MPERTARQSRRDLGVAGVKGGRVPRLDRDVDGRTAGSGITALTGLRFLPVQHTHAAFQDRRHLVWLEIGAVMETWNSSEYAHRNHASDTDRKDVPTVVEQRKDAAESPGLAPMAQN